MITLPYSLIIEATDEPDFFGFHSTELEGFSGIGHSVEDCLFRAKWGMKEHVDLLKEKGLTIPPQNPEPRIIIQNEKKLEGLVAEMKKVATCQEYLKKSENPHEDIKTKMTRYKTLDTEYDPTLLNEIYTLIPKGKDS